ncbi:MAG: YqjF family protein [Actinocrinis sp.]
MPPSARVALIEPVTPEPVRPVRRALLTQSWLDLAFLHWAVTPDVVRPLLPRGTEPDVLDGHTYIGLIAFRMHRVGLLGLPGTPWLGSFPETNVRLYSVDRAGRRAVVFLTLDAARLLPVLVGRIGFGLPYVWSRMSARRTGDVMRYTSSRHRPARRSVASNIRVRIGEAVGEPTPAEHFMTARWGLHAGRAGRTVYMPNAHPRWPLFRAELLELNENLIAATGLPDPARPPDSVLYSPGVPVRFGPPHKLVPANR